MPDRRRHRGKHPNDDRLFGEVNHRKLRLAVAEYSWLLTRGYAVESGLKIVGDRHGLAVRQRQAVMRSSCSDQALAHRTTTRMAVDKCRGRTVRIDGYNVLITIESALSGGLVLRGRDGCCRDLASVHGTYRAVAETVPAVSVIADYLSLLGVARVYWYLDRPVSNSGRLKTLMGELAEQRNATGKAQPIWVVELVDSPDRVLSTCSEPVATSDSAILDRCPIWFNLAAEIIEQRIPDTWDVDLRDPPPDAFA